MLDPTNTELLAQKQKLLAKGIGETKGRLDSLKITSKEAAKTAGNYDAWKAKYDLLKQKIDETSSKLKDLKAKSKEADKQLANGEISQEKYDALQKKIKSTSDDLKSLQKSAEDVSKEFGHSLSPEQHDALQREIIETERDLQRLESQANQSSTVLEKIAVAGGKLENTGKKISNAGKALLPLTGAVAGIGTTAAVKFAEVDKTMQLTNATMRNTEEEANLLDKAMKDAALNHGFC